MSCALDRLQSIKLQSRRTSGIESFGTVVTEDPLCTAMAGGYYT